MFIEENMKIRAVDKNGKSYSGKVYKIVIQPCEDDKNRPHALLFVSQEVPSKEPEEEFGCIALWVDKLQRIDIL